VDHVGNIVHLGKLRNIRMSANQPWEYLAEMSDRELAEDYIIEDRRLLADDGFEEFAEAPRMAILSGRQAFLGRRGAALLLTPR
jgi:hypothetical protein